jgi:hypothetical protein
MYLEVSVVYAQLASRSVTAPDSIAEAPSPHPALRWAGAGGLVFAATIVVQNILRGANAPSNEADSATIAAYYAQHAPIESLLLVLFTLGGFGLMLFAGGVWARAIELDPGTRPWAQAGVLGVAGIVALFSGLVACEVALRTAAGRSDLGAESIGVLWVLHNSIFSVLTLPIGVALLGLSQATVPSGLTHPSFKVVGVLGACMLAFNTAVAPLIAATTSPLMAVGLVGFVCWVAFVVVTSYKLVRG